MCPGNSTTLYQFQLMSYWFLSTLVLLIQAGFESRFDLLAIDTYITSYMMMPGGWEKLTSIVDKCKMTYCRQTLRTPYLSQVFQKLAEKHID